MLDKEASAKNGESGLATCTNHNILIFYVFPCISFKGIQQKAIPNQENMCKSYPTVYS